MQPTGRFTDKPQSPHEGSLALFWTKNSGMNLLLHSSYNAPYAGIGALMNVWHFA